MLYHFETVVLLVLFKKRGDKTIVEEAQIIPEGISIHNIIELSIKEESGKLVEFDIYTENDEYRGFAVDFCPIISG